MEIADVIRKTKLALSFTGVKEDTGLTTDKFINKWLFYLNTIWLYSDVIAEIFWLIEAIHLGISFEDISILAPCMTVSILSTAKMVPLYFNRDILIQSLDKLNNLNTEFFEEVNVEIVYENTDPKETENKERDIDIPIQSLDKLNNLNTEFFEEVNVEIVYENTDPKETENKERDIDIPIQSLDKLNNLNTEFFEEVNVEIVYENTDPKDTEKKEKDILRNSKWLLNNVVVLMTYVCYVVVIVFSCMPVISMCYDYYEKGETGYKLPFLVKYFFDPFTRTRWPFVYFHQIWSTVIAAINVFASDTLFYVYCVCIDMHFQILCLRLEHVFTSPLSNCDNMTLEFKNFLRRHQELILLVDQVEILYSKSLLFNIITSSFLICLSGFNITSLDDTGAVVAFITFLFMSLSQISLLCYFGDLLMKSSAAVSDAIYKSNWYIMDRDVRSSVVFVITRAQKPCKLTAWKFADLNLSAFTTILSRSWSYFALLRTMYD